MICRLLVKGSDLDEVTADMHALGISDVSHIPLPTGDYIVGFASTNLGHHHVANSHAKTERLPQPHHPAGLKSHVAARFSHIKDAEGISPRQLFEKLYAAHPSPLLDPDLT